MSKKNQFELKFPKKLSEVKKDHYKKLHNDLPAMKENQINLTAVEIDFPDPDTIIVTSFIRSTVNKTVRLENTNILLIDKNAKVLSDKKEDFSELGPLTPNSSQLYTFIFPNKNIQTLNPDEAKNWSLAFESNLKHRVDYSDLDESKIPQSTKDRLQEIIEKMPLDENELSFVGFSAKSDDKNNLQVSLLIRNGTEDDLDIKQLPLRFYDGSKELTAQGTFKIEDFTVLANTSKPLSLVFPAKSIIKDELDLSSWSVEHNE